MVTAGTLSPHGNIYEKFAAISEAMVSDGNPEVYLHRGRTYTFECVYDTTDTYKVCPPPKRTV